jgi:hypothetical protein
MTSSSSNPPNFNGLLGLSGQNAPIENDGVVRNLIRRDERIKRAKQIVAPWGPHVRYPRTEQS